MKWLIEYEDGSVFSDADGEPWQAPRVNVRNIFQVDDMVDVVIEKSPHVGVWVWKVDKNGKNGQWFGLDDMWAFWSYLWHYDRSPIIAVFGVMEHDHDWGEYVRARAKQYWGIDKDSWKPRERRHP